MSLSDNMRSLKDNTIFHDTPYVIVPSIKKCIEEILDETARVQHILFKSLDSATFEGNGIDELMNNLDIKIKKLVGKEITQFGDSGKVEEK